MDIYYGIYGTLIYVLNTNSKDEIFLKSSLCITISGHKICIHTKLQRHKIINQLLNQQFYSVAFTMAPRLEGKAMVMAPAV